MYTVRIFMKCMHACVAQTSYLLFTKLYIKPDFPSLADEIAEPHPDMNIKVAAFTVREKSSNNIIKDPSRILEHNGAIKSHLWNKGMKMVKGNGQRGCLLKFACFYCTIKQP